MSDDKKVIFSMSGVTKTYKNANVPVIKDIYLSFFYGAKIGILGLNGSGKSTLLRIIAGEDSNYQGNVVFAPGYSVGYLEQDPQLDDSKTVIEIVKEGVADIVAVLDEYNKVNDMFALPEVYEDADKMQKLMDKQAELQDKIDASNAWELDTKLEIAMDALRTPEGDKKISVLSGGERRRVALCRLLLQEPDVLLLDEPTNHLDAESVHWLEHHLAQYKGTVIAVTHDRYFLDNVAGWILELDRGEGIPWKGNYSSWLDQKSKRLAQESKQASKRQKTLERELEWVRQGARGRQAKQKARLKNYDKLLNQDQKQLDEKLEIYIPNGPRLGTNVIEAKGVSKAFDEKLLYDDLNFVLPQAGIGEDIDNETLGGATTHSEISGVTDYKAKDDQDALDTIKNLISKLGAPLDAGYNRVPSKKPQFDSKDIFGILPISRSDPYNMLDIINRLVDNSEFKEYKEGYGKTLITGYGRIEGWAVGIVANQRKVVKTKKGEMQFGGVIYSDSADKATRFIANCNQKKIPLVFLQDVTGFMVGSKSEHGGIIKDGAKMVNAVSNSVVPKFTVIIGNSYGAGNYAMCGKAYDPRLIVSWPSAELAVMSGKSAAKVLLQIEKASLEKKGQKISEQEEKALYNKIKERYDAQISPYYAAAHLWTDAIIDPLETRKWISMGIEAANQSPQEKPFNMGVLQV